MRSKRTKVRISPNRPVILVHPDDWFSNTSKCRVLVCRHSTLNVHKYKSSPYSTYLNLETEVFIPFKFLRAHKEVHIANGHIWVFVANYLWFYIDAIFYCLDNEIVNANAFLDSKTVEHRDSRGYIQLLAICSYSSNGEKSKFILPASFIEIHKVPH